MVDLFTKEEWKEHHGTPAAVTVWDAWLDNVLAPTLTDLIDRACQRTFAQTAHVEILDGSGERAQSIKNPPIEPSSPAPIVNVDPNRVFGASTIVAATKYFIFQRRRIKLFKGTSVAASLLNDSGVFPLGDQNVKITYTGGFATVPIQIKTLALEWGVAIFNRRRSAGITSQSVGAGGTISYRTDPLTKDQRATLNSFRIHRLIPTRE